MSDRLAKLRQLHQANPADPFCTYGLALEHAKIGDTTAALDWLEKTLALDADYFYAYFQKGKLLAKAGQRADGRAAVQAGLTRAQASTHADAAHAAKELASLLETM